MMGTLAVKRLKIERKNWIIQHLASILVAEKIVKEIDKIK